MKKYKILAECVTGFSGKPLLKGEVHPESEFTPCHCPLLCNAGHIEEVKEETPKKPTKVQTEKPEETEKLDGE